MIDGIDSNEIGANFLLIFNCEEESEIDEDILGCNNLLGVIKFEYLSNEESNELSNHLNQKVKYKEETKLLNILKGKNRKKQSSIGF
jgi:hypothetical protein